MLTPCSCTSTHPITPSTGQSSHSSNAESHIATTYARGHLSDLPGVVLAREGRLWGLYASGAQIAIRSDCGRRRGPRIPARRPISQLDSRSLDHRGWDSPLQTFTDRDLVVVVAPIVAAALNAALSYGSTRYTRRGGALGRCAGGDRCTVRSEAPTTCAMASATSQSSQGRRNVARPRTLRAERQRSA